jgi:hypothetical protein
VLRRRGPQLSATDVRARLRDECCRRGGQRAWARVHDVADTYVSGVISGRLEPGPKILRALGLARDPATYSEIWEPPYAEK